jgi:hypothetical protein
MFEVGKSAVDIPPDSSGSARLRRPSQWQWRTVANHLRRVKKQRLALGAVATSQVDAEEEEADADDWS